MRAGHATSTQLNYCFFPVAKNSKFICSTLSNYSWDAFHCQINTCVLTKTDLGLLAGEHFFYHPLSAFSVINLNTCLCLSDCVGTFLNCAVSDRNRICFDRTNKIVNTPFTRNISQETFNGGYLGINGETVHFWWKQVEWSLPSIKWGLTFFYSIMMCVWVIYNGCQPPSNYPMTCALNLFFLLSSRVADLDGMCSRACLKEHQPRCYVETAPVTHIY